MSHMVWNKIMDISVKPRSVSKNTMRGLFDVCDAIYEKRLMRATTLPRMTGLLA